MSKEKSRADVAGTDEVAVAEGAVAEDAMGGTAGVAKARGGKAGGFFRAIGRFIKRHKRLSAFVLVLLVAGAGTLAWLTLNRSPVQAAGGFTMPETTMLAKMDLEMTVTATGTLESSAVNTVTSDLSYEVAEIYVEVGDVVQAGQMLCRLDETEVQELIADTRADIADAASEDAKALARLQEALQDAVDKRDENLAKNEASVTDALNTYNAAEKTLKTAKATAQTAAGTLETMIRSTLSGAGVAGADYPGDATIAAITSTGEAQRLNDDGKALSDAAYAAITADGGRLKLYFDELASAQQAVTNASGNVDSTYSAYEKAVETRDAAYESDTKTITSAQESYDDRAGQDSAEALREMLEDYLEDLEELTITAPAAGTVTEIGAVVGKSAGGSSGSSVTGTSGGTTLFTLEDMDALEVDVSVADYDAITMKTGLSARLTVDALEGESWDAVVTAISVKASSGYFTLTVKVTSPVGQLAAGMSATADIITESRQDVYAVPYDAVVTNSAGQTVVYALDTSAMGGGFGRFQQGGDDTGTAGADADDSGDDSSDRIEIVVETGFETDYYIEISGDGLSDGLLILNDPLGLNVLAEGTTGDTGDFSGGMMGGIFGGGEGGGRTMPEGGGMPSGGGNMTPPTGTPG